MPTNSGCELRLASIANPLVAPPAGARWEILWSSEETCYGGGGTAPPEILAGWRIAGESALLLHATKAKS